MSFIREIPVKNITDVVVNELTNFGFVLIWKEDSIEVWANVVRS
jgi:hypothetical protein